MSRTDEWKIRITADTAQFAQQANVARKVVDSLNQSFAGTGKSAPSFQAMATSVGSFNDGLKGTTGLLDQQRKMVQDLRKSYGNFAQTRNVFTEDPTSMSNSMRDFATHAQAAQRAMNDLQQSWEENGKGTSHSPLENPLGKDKIGAAENLDAPFNQVKKALKEVNPLLDQHSKQVADLSRRYQTLEDRSRFMADNPEKYRQIRQEQLGVLKNLEKRSQDEVEYYTAVQRTQSFQEEHQTVLGSQKRPPSAYSTSYNANYGNTGLNQAYGWGQLGRVASNLGGMGRDLYGESTNAYVNLNRQFRFDDSLSQSEWARRRSELNLGKQLSGFERSKNDITSWAMNSPFSVPAAIAGEFGGTALGVVGSGLQIYGGLKALSTAKKLTQTAAGTSGVVEAATGAAKTAGTVSKTVGAAEAGASLLGTAAEVGGGAAAAYGLGTLATEAKAASLASKAGGFIGLVSKLGPLAAASLGGAGAVGGGILTGQLASWGLGALTGGKVGGSNLAEMWDAQGQGRGQADDVINTDAFKKQRGMMTESERKQQTDFYDAAIPAMRELQKSRPFYNGGEGGLVADKRREDSSIEELKKIFSDAGKPMTKEQESLLRGNAVKTDELLTQYQEYSKAYGGKGEKADGKKQDESTILDRIKQNSPTFSIQQQRTLNQIKDFSVDIGRDILQTTRSWSRQQQDITKETYRAQQDYAKESSRAQQDYARTTFRTEQDYQMQLHRLDIQRDRAEQDTNKELTRNYADYTKSKTRADQDYSLNLQEIQLGVYRTERNYQIQSSRIEEDYQRTSLRNAEDFQRAWLYLQQDISRETTRLAEDTATSRYRIDQDYQRNRFELERNAARSMEDLNRNLSYSLAEMFAPGLSNNKAWQFMKLMQQYNVSKKRLGEDVQFQEEGQDIQYGRSQYDLNKQYSRGMEDIQREQQRQQLELQIQKDRTEEDLSIQRSRASFDLLTSTTDALVDASLAKLQADLNHVRAMEDLDVAFARSLEDIQIAYARAMEDLSLSQQEAAIAYTRAMADAALQYQRTMQDLDISLQRTMQDLETSFTRGKEDFDFAMEGIKNTADRFARDFGLSLQEEMLNLKELTGESMSDIASLYQQASQAIAQAESNAVGHIQSASASAPPDVGYYEGPTIGGGYHASGLNYVPVDNYFAKLHRGEMVVPRPEAEKLRQPSGQALLKMLESPGMPLADELRDAWKDLEAYSAKGSSRALHSAQENLYAALENLNVGSPSSSAKGASADSTDAPGYTQSYQQLMRQEAIGGGYHANGLDYVPWDNYLAKLHTGEMVLPRGVAEKVRQPDITPPATNGQQVINFNPKFVLGGQGDAEIEAKLRGASREMLRLLMNSLGRSIF